MAVEERERVRAGLVGPRGPVDDDGPVLDRSAAERVDRVARRRFLGVEIAALPGDEQAAGDKEREGKLDELGERRDGPRGDRRPAFAMTRIGGECLGSDRPDADTVRDAHGTCRDRDEPCFLANRVDEQCLGRGHRGGQRQAREPAAAPEVEERVAPGGLQNGEPGQAVRDMADPDLDRIADRGQIDRLVPSEQEPDMSIDRLPRDRGKGDAQVAQRLVEGAVVGGGQLGTGFDARRERVPRTVQALLLSAVPTRAVRAPLPATSFVTPRSTPVFRGSSGSGRVSPYPSRAPLPGWFGADAGR
jgi:hypothetical protein